MLLTLRLLLWERSTGAGSRGLLIEWRHNLLHRRIRVGLAIDGYPF